MSEATLQSAASVQQPDVMVTYHAATDSLTVLFDYSDAGGGPNYSFTGTFAEAPGRPVQGFDSTSFDAKLLVSGVTLGGYSAPNSVTAAIGFGDDPESNDNCVIAFSAAGMTLGTISADTADGTNVSLSGAIAKA